VLAALPLAIAELELEQENEREHERLNRELQLVPMPRPPDIIDWAEQSFYIPETGKPIELMGFQKAILRYIFRLQPDGRWPFTTVVWSTVKKSGKTAQAGLVARWAAETWGRHGEVSCLANDFEQAQGRTLTPTETSQAFSLYCSSCFRHTRSTARSMPARSAAKVYPEPALTPYSSTSAPRVSGNGSLPQ